MFGIRFKPPILQRIVLDGFQVTVGNRFSLLHIKKGDGYTARNTPIISEITICQRHIFDVFGIETMNNRNTINKEVENSAHHNISLEMGRTLDIYNLLMEVAFNIY